MEEYHLLDNSKAFSHHLVNHLLNCSNTCGQLYPYLPNHLKINTDFFEIYLYWIVANINENRSKSTMFNYYDKTTIPINYFAPTSQPVWDRMITYLNLFISNHCNGNNTKDQDDLIVTIYFSKEKFIQSMTKLSSTICNHAYIVTHLFKPEFAHDIRFCESLFMTTGFMENYPIQAANFYRNLPEATQSSQIIQRAILNITGDLLLIPNIDIYSLSLNKDLSLMKKIVNHNPSLLGKLDKQWRCHPEIIVAAHMNFDYLNKEEWETLLADTNNLHTLAKSSPKNLALLVPPAYRTKELFLVGIIYQPHSLNSHILWQEQDFCIQALSVNYMTISHINDQFWHDSEFSITALKILDDNYLPQDFFQELPQYMQLFFLRAGVKNQYSQYLKSFILEKKLRTNMTNNKKQKTIQKI